MSGTSNQAGQGASVMNCQTSLQILATGDEQVSGWDAACNHLAECPVCQQAFRAGDEWDRQLATVTRAVAVPVGLEDRILSALHKPAVTAAAIEQDLSLLKTRSTTQPTPAITPQPRVSRRRVLSAAASVACLVLVGAGYFAWEASQKVTIDHLKEVVAQQPPERESLPPFTGFRSGVELKFPRDLRISQELEETDPRQLKIGRHVAAAYFFKFRTEHENVVAGWLFAIPARAVKSPPDWEGVGMPAPGASSAAYPVVSWREGDLIYVCALTGGGGEDELYHLFDLQQAM